MSTRPRLVIADDHELLRDALAAYALNKGGLEVVASVGDAQSAIIACAERRPDNLVIDIEMPGRDSIAAIADIKAASPSTRVVVLSAYCKEAMIVAALRNGAAGYVLKTEPPAEIFAALKRVLSGETVLSQQAQRLVPAGGRRGEAPATLLSTLTPRELEVLRSIGRGCDNNQMAEAMHLSKSTVERHIERLMNTVGIHTRAGLVKLAYDQGLVV